MHSLNYINNVYTSNLNKNNFLKYYLNQYNCKCKSWPWQHYFTPLYRNTTSAHNYNEQLHLKIRNFKDNSCLYVVDNVLPVLNCLSMFIFVYNSVRALGTLGPVLDLF